VQYLRRDAGSQAQPVAAPYTTPRPSFDPAFNPESLFGYLPPAAAVPTKPGPQPTNAGLTPGYRHLLTAGEPVTRRQIRRVRRRDRRSAGELAEAVARLEARVRELERCGRSGAR
jgi:hypothetical protein